MHFGRLRSEVALAVGWRKRPLGRRKRLRGLYYFLPLIALVLAAAFLRELVLAAPAGV